MLWRKRYSDNILLFGLIIFMVLGSISLALFFVGLVVFGVSVVIAGD